jgi:hypothetical protein
MGVIGAILSFLSGWFARLLGAGAIRAVIWKGIIYALFVAILPTVLYNLFSLILQEFLSIASSYGSQGQSIVVTFTGFIGWLAYNLKIPEAFSMLLSALAFRVTISFIPFLNKI